MSKGVLYIVATPIGNLQDMSLRAQTILRQVNLIAAEDTRHSRHLLDFLGIKTPLQSLHEHNERQISRILLERLHAGEQIALISDAGTPLISDPGFYLVQTAHTEQLPIVPIPGPCALISALSVAGLPTDRFIFEGFLPAKESARRQRLEILAYETRTMVFYEAPHRVVDCLKDMSQIWGEQRIALLAKELTKKFETLYRDTLRGIFDWITVQPERQRGEFVLIVQGALEHNPSISEAKRIFQVLRKELSLKQAAKLTREITGVSKNTLYAWGLEENPDQEE